MRILVLFVFPIFKLCVATDTADLIDWGRFQGRGFDLSESRQEFRGLEKLTKQLQISLYVKRHAAYLSNADIDSLFAEIEGNGKAGEGRRGFPPQTVEITDKHRTHLLYDVKYDTFAIRSDSNRELYISANTKTRGDFNWEVVKQGSRFSDSEFGLRPTDHSTLLKVVSESPQFRDRIVHIIETVELPTSSDAMHKPHAEMKLLHHKQTHANPLRPQESITYPWRRQGDRQSIIVQSKPACSGCAGELNNVGTLYKDIDIIDVDGDDNMKFGLDLDERKPNMYNWVKPERIGEMTRTTYIPRGTEGSSEVEPIGVCSSSGGGRRRRSTDSHCIFYSQNKPEKDKLKTPVVDSEGGSKSKVGISDGAKLLENDENTGSKLKPGEGSSDGKPKPNLDMDTDGDGKTKVGSIPDSDIDGKLAQVPDNAGGKLKSGKSSDPVDGKTKQNFDVEDNLKRPIKPQVYDLDIRRVQVPDHKIDTIDSKRLSNLLLSTDGGTDIESVKARQAVVDLATKNQDKLSGTDDEVRKAKAQLSQDNLDSHDSQNSLARTAISDPNQVTPKAASRFQKVKVSMSKFAAKTSKFSSKTSKVSNPYGKIMLAKGVVTALRHGDMTSLGVMGGRIGLEYALKGVEKLGVSIAKKATTKFMTKLGSQVLGKMAGPVGAVADIGLNIWSITKSAKILNDPNASKFDQNNAIADIVADSIDIAITATAAVLALVFPPLAPVFAAVAFIINVVTTLVVGFYKAANHVDRINSEMPLLDYEKTGEYFRYMTGSETSTYIQELIDTKKANNIVVNLTVTFLQNNPDYIGKVFPARTFHNPAGDCYLEKKRCDQLMHFIPAGCTDWYRVSKCSGPGGRCRGEYSDSYCEGGSSTVVIPIEGHSVHEKRCNCESDPPPEWRHEIPNSVVDFRDKKYIYLQRALPHHQVPKGFRYLCKPGSLNHEGDRVSQDTLSYGYLCYGAIGIEGNSKSGKFMLYDLGEGEDIIDLNESDQTDALIVVKDGVKQFKGGGGDDTFVVDGPCNNLKGLLEGKTSKSGGDTIVIGQNCGGLMSLKIDFGTGVLYSDDKEVSVSLLNVERVIGRSDKTDWIKASCTTTFISGGGGHGVTKPDVIELPNCGEKFELTILAQGSSTVDAESVGAGAVYILVQNFTRFTSKLPTSLNNGGTLLYKMEGSLAGVTFEGVNTMMFTFDGESTAQFSVVSLRRINNGGSTCSSGTNNAATFVIDAGKGDNLQRHILYNVESKTFQCVIKVSRMYGKSPLTNSVEGYAFLETIFQLAGPGKWVVRGSSNKNDQFHLSSPAFSGSIDGQSGHNILLIQLPVSITISVDLQNGTISGLGSISIKNVHKIVGRNGGAEMVRVNCDSTYFDLKGGSQSAPDIITIPSQTCIHDISIKGMGHLEVIVQDGKQADIVTITLGYYDDECVTTISTETFHLSLINGGVGTSLQINLQAQHIVQASPNLVRFKSGSQVKINGNFPSISLAEGNNLSSILVLNGDEIVSLHELRDEQSSNVPSLRQGAKMVSNLFKLIHGHWIATGGELDDKFILESVGFYVIDGKGGSNSFIVSQNFSPPLVEIDMISGTLNSLSDGNILESIGRISSVSSVYGRPGMKESLVCGCGMDTISLGGGRGNAVDDYDSLHIRQDSCSSPQKMTIIAGGCTEFKFEGRSGSNSGEFLLYIQPDVENRMRFLSTLSPKKNDTFTISVQMLSYKLSDYRVIKSGRNLIEIRLKFQENENFVNFKLTLPDPINTILSNFNVMFTDSNYSSNGNLLFNTETGDLQVLHVLEESISGLRIRRGAVGAPNVFRLNIGRWEVHGGKYNDAFLLNGGGDAFGGKINGHGGINSLLLMESFGSTSTSPVELDLFNKVLSLDGVVVFHVENIQIVNGRAVKSEHVKIDCDTKLLMLEGGESPENSDIITIPNSFCTPAVSLVVVKYTKVYNFAIRGNFTYHVRTGEDFSISYIPTNSTMHSFKFELALETFSFVKIANNTVLEVTMAAGSRHYFPLNFHHFPQFYIGENEHLLTELFFQQVGIIEAVTKAKSSHSGDIIGLGGVENSIITEVGGGLNRILCSNLDDSIFLAKVSFIHEIDGGLGTNQLEFMDTLHPGRGLEVDLRDMDGAVYFLNEDGKSHNDSFVLSLKNMSVFVGREAYFDRVILGCGTKVVKNGDIVAVKEVNNCEGGYNVRIYVGMGTRVVFELDNDKQQDDELFVIIGQGDKEEDDDFNLPLPPSNFYYHFTIVKSFDIETTMATKFSRLWQTKHTFYLNFTLSQLTNIHFSQSQSRLIYTIHPHNNVEYSHLVLGLDSTEMFYSKPEFMTNDGFLIRISRYSEILISFGNLDEALDLETVQSSLIPRMSEMALRLSVSFMIETGSDFIYCGNGKEVNVLSNRANVTSHLVGYNQSTYVVFDLDRDVYIYANVNISSGSKDLHVIDLSEMVLQIRNITGVKYVPLVHESGKDLVITMSGYESKYPGSTVIVNGTLIKDNLRVLLNSIVMDIVRVEVDLDKGGWQIVPRPIQIPSGFVYLLAAEDLEDGVEIREENRETLNNSQNYEYTRDKDDLLVTNVDRIATHVGQADEEPTTFIISGYFNNDAALLRESLLSNNASASFGLTNTVNNVKINLGGVASLVQSGESPIDFFTHERITVSYYEDVLEEAEALVLQEFPEIRRKFEVPLIKKIERNGTLLSIFWGAVLASICIVGCMVWTFCRKKPVKGKYVVDRTKPRDEHEMSLFIQGRKEVGVQPEERKRLKKYEHDTSSAS